MAIGGDDLWLGVIVGLAPFAPLGGDSLKKKLAHNGETLTALLRVCEGNTVGSFTKSRNLRVQSLSRNLLREGSFVETP